MVRPPLPRPCFPQVSHCLPTCVPVFDGAPPSQADASHCFRTCVLVFDAVPVFPRFCLPAFPISLPLFLLPFVGRCVRLPVLAYPCLPLCSNVSHLPSCFLPFVGWCARLPKALSPLLSPIVSQCHPTCVPVLDSGACLPRSCLHLSPVVSPHACVGGCVWLLPTCAFVGWCAHLPEVLPPLVCHCLSFFPQHVCVCLC